MQIDRRQPENRLLREVMASEHRKLTEALRRAHAEEQAARPPSTARSLLLAVLLGFELSACLTTLGLALTGEFPEAQSAAAIGFALWRVRLLCENSNELI